MDSSRAASVTATSTSDSNSIKRPALVEESLKENKPIFYFGLGSNMSKTHLENRSFCGQKIHVLRMEAAVVYGHRLAFNLRAFPPLEPAMGSLERCVLVGNNDSDDDEKIMTRQQQQHPKFPNAEGEARPSIPLYAYERPECHGALIQLSSTDYEKVMQSEGVSGSHFQVRGYEEVVVDAVPYDQNNNKSPVQAVALRVLPHARLSRDAAPSARYMKILRDGAAELGLSKSYQDFLATHPVQQTPVWLQLLSLPNFIFSFSLFFTNSDLLKQIASLQNKLLFLVYVPPTSPAPLRMLSNVALGIVVFPGSLVGLGILAYRQITQTCHPPLVQRFVDRLKNQMIGREVEEAKEG